MAITKEQAIAELARRELVRRGSIKDISPNGGQAPINIKGPNQIKQSAIAGPVGLMPDVVDIPGMITSGLNGLLMGQPRTMLEFPMEGPLMANMKSGANTPSNLSNLLNLATRGRTPVIPQSFQTSGIEQILPEAVTPGGKVASALLELAGATASGIGLEALPSRIANSKIGKQAGEIINSGKMLKAVESEQTSLPVRRFQYQQEMKSVRAGKVQSMKDITRDFQIKNEQLGKSLQNDAIFKSAENKAALRKTFKGMSDTYKKGIEEAETALQAKGIQIDSADYLQSVVDKTIQDLTLKGLPEDLPAFKEIRDLSLDLSPKIKAPTSGPMDGIMNASPVSEIQAPKNLSIKDLMKFKASVYKKLSPGLKKGTEYLDQNDYIAQTFLRNHAQYIAKNSTELAQMNKEFAPLAEARRWAMRTFKPYSEAEIERGASVLRRVASSEKPNQTDINFLKMLEQGSGRFKGAGDLRGGTTQSGQSIIQQKKIFNSAKQNLIDATDFKIAQIQSKMARMQKLGIELKFERERLKKLVDTRNIVRNIVIGLSVSALASPIVKKAIGSFSRLQE